MKIAEALRRLLGTRGDGGDGAAPAGRIGARSKRWLLGGALSMAAHLLCVGGVVFTASAPRSGQGGVDLARESARGPEEGVPVDVVGADFVDGLVDLPRLSDPLPEDDDTVVSPAQPRPARRAAARSRPSAERSATGEGVRTRRLAGAPGVQAQAAASPVPAPSHESPDVAPAVPPPDPAELAAAAARTAFRAQLRRHLQQAWRANEVFGRIDPQGRLQGSLFTTGISVRLRADGSIESSQLAEPSGVEALDEEALGALARMERLPPVPGAMLDEQRGWNVLCKFYLDVGMFRFAADLRRAIAASWQPSKAFTLNGDKDRRTVLKLSLVRDGTLLGAEVVQSAGIDFLDANAVKFGSPGLKLPAPPPAFTKQPGPASVFVAFLHLSGDVRMVRPREDVEAE